MTVIHVFELSPDGNEGWTENALYRFTGGTDGGSPNFAGLTLDSAGNLYGTASFGGANGYGVVFELSPEGTSWTETVVYSFCSQENCTDGASPRNGLVMDKAGNLYGTAFYGPNSAGGIFELSPSGGAWMERIIYVFDGLVYSGLTTDSVGDLFGVTSSTVFELSPNGDGNWNPSVIHTFAGPPKDGSAPEGTLALDQAGNLYGTTTGGGSRNLGTVYEVVASKNGWKEKVLHNFRGGKDGQDPRTGVALDNSGNIYGTSAQGGQWNAGTVYELQPQAGRASYKEMVLWSFDSSDGNLPEGGLVLDSAGDLYGTTSGGGAYSWGVVFKLVP